MLDILQSIVAQLIDLQSLESSTSDATLARGPRDLGMRRGRGEFYPSLFIIDSMERAERLGTVFD
jgi:hypothetical protein